MTEWKKYRVKDVARLIGSGATPTSGNDRYYENGIHYWVNTGDFNNSEIYGCKQLISDTAIREIPTLRFYPINTILVAMYGASIGKVGILKVKATVNQACCAIALKENLFSSRFLFYLLINCKDSLLKESFGGTQPNVSKEIIANLIFEIPSLQEQQRIVEYLDAKTTEIDKKIELLGKKRDAYKRLKTATINHAVTRGLDEHVKMKDSGVEWIGEIPEHWEIKRFKDIFSTYTTGLTPESKNESNFSDDEKYTWVTIGDMTSRVVAQSILCLSEKAVKEMKPTISVEGSLLFSFKLSIGKTAFAGKNLYTNEAIVSIPPRPNVDLVFFYYLTPLVCKNNATENIYGAQMLNQRIIANMLLIHPPLEEQKQIAAYLDERCAKIDAAVTIIDKQIDALKRLKRSLINEVVTGKRMV